jgi:hypothetical protein
MIMSLTVPAWLTNLASRRIPGPVRRSVPEPGTVAIRTALPVRRLSFGLESTNEFDGFAGGGTKDDGEARTVNDAVAVLAACMTSPEYAAVIDCAPARLGVKLS